MRAQENSPQVTQVVRRLAWGFPGPPAGCKIAGSEIIDAARNFVDTVLQNLVRDLFLVKDHHLFNRAKAALEVLADRDGVAESDDHLPQQRETRP